MIDAMRLSTAVILVAAAMTFPSLELVALLERGEPSIAATTRRVPTPSTPSAAKASGSAPSTPSDGAVAPAPVTPAATGTPSPGPPPTSSAPVVPAASTTTALIRSAGVDVFATPSATPPALHLSPDTDLGSPRLLLAVTSTPGWLQVLLPIRPNNALGWVRAGAVDQRAGLDEVRVSLQDRTLE